MLVSRYVYVCAYTHIKLFAYIYTYTPTNICVNVFELVGHLVVRVDMLI